MTPIETDTLQLLSQLEGKTVMTVSVLDDSTLIYATDDVSSPPTEWWVFSLTPSGIGIDYKQA